MSIQFQIGKSFFGACLAVALVACASSPKQGTPLGAIAGGVVGAGLGAVVGNQTGDVGEGLALGALAGVAAGTIIGNKFDAHDEELEKQTVALDRIRQERNAQAQELSALRNQVEQSRMRELYKNARSVKVTGGASSPRKSWGSTSPVANRPKGVKLGAVTTYTKKNTKKVSAKAAIKEEEVIPVVSKKNQRKAVTVKSTPREVVPQVQAPAAPAAPTLATIDPFDIEEAAPAAVENKSKSVPVAPASKIIEKNAVRAAPAKEKSSDALSDFDEIFGAEGMGLPAKEPATTAQEPLGSYQWGKGTECKQADAEAKKGEHATDSADKLYHLRRAIRLCPNEASYHHTLGTVYTQLGRKLDAEFELGEARRLSSR